MSRVDWVSGALTPEQLAALTERLTEVFAGFRRYHGREVSRKQIETFAAAINEALDGYAKLLKPAASELRQRGQELQALVAAVPAVIRAVNGLSEDTRDRLQLAQWASARRPPQIPEFEKTEQVVQAGDDRHCGEGGAGENSEQPQGRAAAGPGADIGHPRTGRDLRQNIRGSRELVG
jgi:hypothetical protein